MIVSSILCVNFVLAATESNMNTVFTVRQPLHPLKPVLFDLPTAEICQTSIDVNGRAESNVEVYVNGSYKTVSAMADGSFALKLFLEEGENIFQITAKRSGDFSEPSNYTIQNELSCIFNAAYAGSSTSRKTTDSVKVEVVADHLSSRKTDEYISETLHVKDIVIEPIETATPSDKKPTGTESKRDPFREAVKDGVEHTFDDLDNDGLSDLAEEVLNFDINTKDSDNDGIVDSEEIRIGAKIVSEESILNVNFAEGTEFACDELLLHGDLSYAEASKETAPKMSLCLSGKNDEECFDIDVESDGSFLSQLSPKLKEGSYNARFEVDGTALSEFQTSCTVSANIADVMISKVDFQKVYEDKEGRAVKKIRLYSLNPQPVVQGIGSNHDMVFGFWMQDDKKVAQSIALSDANGVFETKPHKKLRSSFGFGKAKIVAYGLSNGKFGGVDEVNFYIFDLFVIALEITVLALTVVILKRIRRRLSGRKRR